MDITIVLILLVVVVGVVFFLVELFLISGISVAGIAGIPILEVQPDILRFFGSILLLGIAICFFLRSKALDRTVLKG